MSEPFDERERSRGEKLLEGRSEGGGDSHFNGELLKGKAGPNPLTFSRELRGILFRLPLRPSTCLGGEGSSAKGFGGKGGPFFSTEEKNEGTMHDPGLHRDKRDTNGGEFGTPSKGEKREWQNS